MIEYSGFDDNELGPWDPELDDVEAHLDQLQRQRNEESGNEALHLSRMPRPKTPEELREVLPMLTARVEKAFPRALTHVALTHPDETRTWDAKEKNITLATFDTALDTHRLRAKSISTALEGPNGGWSLAPNYVLSAYAPTLSDEAYDGKPFLAQDPTFTSKEGVPGKWFDITLPGLRNGQLHPRHATAVLGNISDHVHDFMDSHLYYPLAEEDQRGPNGKLCFTQPMLPMSHQRDRDLLDREGPQAMYFEHLRIALLGLEAVANQRRQ